MEKDRYQRQYEESLDAWHKDKSSFGEVDYLDEDGYPTESALDIVSRWHWADAEDYFKFIKALWTYADSGYWREDTVLQDEFTNMKYKESRRRYYLSTAGWSGNEAIIRAMQQNEMMWHLNWVQSRRGGHYIFELKEFA